MIFSIFLHSVLDCPSIFDSKQEIKEKYGIIAVRPLADKTMRRAIRGVDQFTIKSGDPFLVQVNHDGNDNRVGASLIQYHTEQTERVRGQQLKEPIMTIDAANRYGLVSASFTKYYGNDDHGHDAKGPLHTTTAKDREGLLASNLSIFHGTSVGSKMQSPAPATLQKDHEAVEAAFLSKFYGGVVGTKMSSPLSTVTAVDHNALTVAHMMEIYGTSVGRGVTLPVSTVTADGKHQAVVATTIVWVEDGVNLGHWTEVRALLNK